MSTIAIFGGTGYAGSAIKDEALRRGHRVISVSRHLPADAATSGVEFRQGSVHDAALVDQVAAEADVIVVSIRFADGGSRVRSPGAGSGGHSGVLRRRTTALL